MPIIDIDKKRIPSQDDYQRVYDGCRSALLLIENLKRKNPAALALLCQSVIPELLDAAAGVFAEFLGVDRDQAADHVLSILFIHKLLLIGGHYETAPLPPSR